jgi:DNA-binding MarR family transcriptional regulator
MNNTKPDNVNEIFRKFVDLVKLYEKLEKTPRSFGTDEMLSGTEIHMIETIGDNDERLSVTDLAKLLGITKGAVSQTLKRLETKVLSSKEEDPENISRSIVKLTSKGKSAFFAHKSWHEIMDGGYKNYFMNLENSKVAFLIEFMDRVDNFLNRAINSTD